MKCCSPASWQTQICNGAKQIRDLGGGAKEDLIVRMKICNYELHKADFWQNEAKLCSCFNEEGGTTFAAVKRGRKAVLLDSAGNRLLPRASWESCSLQRQCS
jgi:hypothetical protein